MAKFPNFCGSSTTCARELATFFAHATQESGKSDSDYRIPIPEPDPPTPDPPKLPTVDHPEKYELMGYLGAVMSALIPFSGAIFSGVLKGEEQDDIGGGGNHH